MHFMTRALSGAIIAASVAVRSAFAAQRLADDYDSRFVVGPGWLKVVEWLGGAEALQRSARATEAFSAWAASSTALGFGTVTVSEEVKGTI